MAYGKGVEAVVAAQSNKVARAAESMDAKEFAALLDDDYLSVNFDGKTHTKAETVAQFREQAFKASSVVVRDQKVRAFGEVAIASGIASVKGSLNGKDISGEYAFTQVFRDKGGAQLTDRTAGESLVMSHCHATQR